MRRLITPVLLAFLFLLFGYIVIAQAQCEPQNNYLSSDFTVESSLPNLYFQQSGDYWDMICTSSWCNYGEDYVSISQPVSFLVVSTSSLDIRVQAMTHGNGSTFRSRVHFDDDTEAYTFWRVIIAGGETVTHQFDLSSYAGKSIDTIYIDYRGVNGFSEQYRFYPLESYFSGCSSSGGSDLCPLVQNAGFFTETGWLISGGSVITDGVLTLPVSGLAAQNLTLQSTTAYSAVISTTQSFSGSTSVDVTLGTQSQTVEITGAGRFTASFTTPSLSGPITYGLENTGPDTVDLDFTCVILGINSDGSTGECLAPVNGTFETADSWTFLRGAMWDSPIKRAELPFEAAGLVVSTPVYTLPTITGTEHLLLSFTSRKLDTTEAGIMGRAIANSSTSANFTFNVYPQEYIFETLLDNLAGETEVQLAFVNPGLEGSAIISSTNDVTLDNICIFITNRLPNLPEPYDPNTIDPVDLGFNYTSCDDVDGLIAGFGVNLQQYRAEYEAGVSVWDFNGWVPWLVAAFWTILAMYLCVFMAAFVTLIDVLEYLLNNFLNIGMWLVRSWPLLLNWLYSVWLWFLATLPNILGWLAQTIVLGLTWFFLSGGNLIIFTGYMLTYFIQAALDFLNWLGFDVPDNVLALFINGIIGIVNLLVAAWNLFLTALELVINGVVNFWVGLWNWLAPVLSAIWAYVSGSGGVFSNPLLALLLAVVNLVLMVVSWVWANVFMVVSIPINFYYAFDNGVKNEAFAYLMSCAETNFWCQMLAGIQLVNQTSAHTLMYPIVIVGIIIGSIVVFWKELWALFSTPVS